MKRIDLHFDNGDTLQLMPETQEAVYLSKWQYSGHVKAIHKTTIQGIYETLLEIQGEENATP